MLNCGLTILRTIKFLYPKSTGYIKRINSFSDVYDKGKAEENVFFIRQQRDQLKALREKILKERSLINKELDKVTAEIKKIKDHEQPPDVVKDANE